MNEKTTTLNIEVKDEGVIHYGQRVYVVASVNSKTFEDKCPVCDGTEKVVIREREFVCPNCSTSNSRRDATRITIRNYSVIEYIINKITIRGRETKADYNRDGTVKIGCEPRLSYEGFTKDRNGYDYIFTKKFTSYELKDPKNVDKVDFIVNLGEDVAFESRSEALKYAKRLHENNQKSLMSSTKSTVQITRIRSSSKKV